MNARHRTTSYPSTSTRPSTAPGVKIDKRTSLRLTSTKGFAEEDVESLVSGLSLSSSADDNGSGARKKPGLLRKLNWRSHPSNNKGQRLPPSTSPLSRKLGAPNPGRTNSRAGKKHGINSIVNDTRHKDRIHRMTSCDATVASLKTSYTRGSQGTTVSTKTLKHSNRGTARNARGGGGNNNRFNCGASVSSSVKSGIPPLARLRDKRVPSLPGDSSTTEEQQYDDDDEDTSCYSQLSITHSAQNDSEIATLGDAITISKAVPSKSINDTDNMESSLQIACSDSGEYCHHNTCTPSKYCPGKSEHAVSPTSVVLAQENVFCGALESFENVDDAAVPVADGNTGNNYPTSIANTKLPSFNKRGVTLSTTKSGKTMETFNNSFSESELTDNNNTGEYRNAMDRMRKLMIGAAEKHTTEQANENNDEKLTDTSMETSIFADLISASNDPTEKLSNNGAHDDESIIQNNRQSGPIDVDTLTRHVTPTERRHLRAMHKLGYYHLRRNEINQALNVFMEILRGQRERHGTKSLEVAMAMHNLGVVCVKGGRFEEGTRLCDGAARIRVENLGKDHLDVAVSLAQQGVALMEMQEYATALASFREALRIRRKGLGSKHPLVIRLLNNIGCALFELNDLVESKIAFEEALSLQRDLMRENSLGGKSSCNDRLTGVFETNDEQEDLLGSEEKNLEMGQKGAHNMLLSIALTLSNLGSIHLRWGKYDESLVFYEEALLIQESVLGEDHKVVINTNESIEFVMRSREENRQALLESHATTSNMNRLASLLLPRYEEGKKIYDKVSNEIASLMDSLASPISANDFTEVGRRNFPCSAGDALDEGHIVKQLVCGQPLMCVDEQSLHP
ncbi:hypothetical protein ACHAWX_004391 [Stephanocyclus meneghinianus]